MVRKSKGFSWGAAGVSNALWTGINMADVIKKARPLRGARYVCMEGADKLVGGSPNTQDPCSFVIAKWLLWNLCQAQLGHGSKSGHHAFLGDERRDASS